MKSFRHIHSFDFHSYYRRTLREIKNSGAGQIILDCRYENLRTVLKQAQVFGLLLLFLDVEHILLQAVGMMTSYFEYIVTSLDMHSIDLEDFKFGGTNITAFRLVDPHNPEVVEVRS